MCFTPLASIITAVVELIIAFYLFHRIKDRKLYPLAIFVFLLGFYQFTEFMLCTTSNQVIWARIGFAVYTFMPILLYHFFVNVSGNRIKRYFYVIPVLFSILALFYPNFINYTSCNLLHVSVNSLVFNGNLVLMSIYLLYYLVFPLYGVYVFSKSIKSKNNKFANKLTIIAAPLALLSGLIYYFWSSVYEKNQIQTWLQTSIIIVVSILILLLISSFLLKKSKELFYKTNMLVLGTTGIVIISLYYIIPDITLNYSSIFCQFALLYAIASVLLVNALDGKVIDRQT